MTNKDIYKNVVIMGTIKQIISLICFTILAIVFNHWWIVFFSIIFMCLNVNIDEKNIDESE